MSLSSAQRKQLRQKAQTQSDDAHLGKAGLTPGFITQLKSLLARKELVKLRLAKEVQGDARQTIADEVAQAVQAELVAVVGKTVLLFRAKD